mgnify:CR=1 FL=1
MERDELVKKGMAAFEAGSFDEALELFSKVMREHQLPEEYLFELGLCELRCAKDDEMLQNALSTLKKVPPTSDKFVNARLEIRSALDDDGRCFDNEADFYLERPEEAVKSGSLLLLSDFGGNLVKKGEARRKEKKIEEKLGLLFSAFEKRYVDGKAHDAYEILTKAPQELQASAKLWQARFLADDGHLSQSINLYEELLKDSGKKFDVARSGWSKLIEKELHEIKEEEKSRKLNGQAREEADRARCLYDAAQYDEALEAWEKSLASAYSRRTILRMSATAWHRKGDDLSAFAYLERLTEKDKKSSEARILKRTIRIGLVERIKKYVRLGLRKAAFEELVKLKGLSVGDEKTTAELEEIFVEFLSSPWVRLLRERLRKNTGLSFRMQEKDSPVWKLLRQARGRMEDDDELDAEVLPDDPSLLPRVQKETAMLRWLEDLILQRERRIVDVFSPDQFAELLEDREGLEEFERLIERLEPILDKHASYSEESHFEVKDFLGSFLPDSLRDKVCNEAYLDVVRMENEIERDLAAFLRKRYPGIPVD